ncbi:ABC transporter ATP-binding protein [Streptomyces althioticus]|uniref:ABC transporter ATP-binding protein n=2 Tax=Streptomyces althioticus group TaxID=2867194 RepID=A0ABR4T9V6_9ACTN|nr:DUF302 domain-containing protein [Actinospica acidiphila]KEG44224.1 ABC transporter ATP-binding protein [Streptomyces griseorubens]GGQ40327.1 ABC transporter ATP-binding protein [Streptomyces althioticus]GGT36860.1 ABC transporter ATP-binding protein [Streptomyces matensis]MBM4832861.1 DUF302 domain-containing protein [Actinospica acidiphila]GGQ82496.1 ABC transporter ATP-binding protein [Streptomyces griseorubens]
MSYDRTVRMAEADFDTATAAVRQALADQGFGILTEIDVRATLRAKLGHDMEDYLILGACSPPLAHQALEADRSIGLLLPCNVVVRRDGDHTLVQALDPGTMVTLTGLDALKPVADEATARLDAGISHRTSTIGGSGSWAAGVTPRRASRASTPRGG